MAQSKSAGSLQLTQPLEPVIQSELSQKKKSKYHILKYICGIEEDGTDEPICRAGIETQT